MRAGMCTVRCAGPLILAGLKQLPISYLLCEILTTYSAITMDDKTREALQEQVRKGVITERDAQAMGQVLAGETPPLLWRSKRWCKSLLHDLKPRGDVERRYLVEFPAPNPKWPDGRDHRLVSAFSATEALEQVMEHYGLSGEDDVSVKEV